MKEKNLATVPWSLNNPSSIRSAREKYAATARYLDEYRAWEERSDKDEKEPKKPKDFDNSAFRVLKGEVFARFNANAREELLGIARFAQEYQFRPVIFGCQEGWTVADELGRAGAYAVVTPRARSVKDERLVRDGGTSIENAAKLHQAGVQVAIIPANTGFDLGGETGRDLWHLPVEAGFGVRGGLSEQAALDSITLVPARILGVDDRVGTLEVGKDFDAIVTDGDLLHYETFVQFAVVAGELVYDKQDEVFFAHIRPRPDRPLTVESKAEALEEESEDEEAAKDAPEEDAAKDEDEQQPEDSEQPEEGADESGDDSGEEPEDGRRAG